MNEFGHVIVTLQVIKVTFKNLEIHEIWTGDWLLLLLTDLRLNYTYYTYKENDKLKFTRIEIKTQAYLYSMGWVLMDNNYISIHRKCLKSIFFSVT